MKEPFTVANLVCNMVDELWSLVSLKSQMYALLVAKLEVNLYWENRSLMKKLIGLIRDIFLTQVNWSALNSETLMYKGISFIYTFKYQ